MLRKEYEAFAGEIWWTMPMTPGQPVFPAGAYQEWLERRLISQTEELEIRRFEGREISKQLGIQEATTIDEITAAIGHLQHKANPQEYEDKVNAFLNARKVKT
jgi:hypothetical protein